MNGENQEIINKVIDAGEKGRIQVLISALRDTETKSVVKKDIISYLLDSYESLTRNDAQFVIDKADDIFVNSATPKNIVVKICVLMKKFREKTKHESPQETTEEENIISVDMPDM